jgi:hypothetical protein
MKVSLALCAVCYLLTQAAWAQTAEVTAKPLTDTDIQLLRSDVQSAKNDIIAHTMQFSDAESTAFWPVYRDYARDQQAIGDQRLRLIKDYAANYDIITYAKAQDMSQRMMDIDGKFLALRQSYWPKFVKVLGAKRAAKFYQVDSRLTMMVNVQLASEIPLIP